MRQLEYAGPVFFYLVGKEGWQLEQKQICKKNKSLTGFFVVLSIGATEKAPVVVTERQYSLADQDKALIISTMEFPAQYSLAREAQGSLH